MPTGYKKTECSIHPIIWKTSKTSNRLWTRSDCNYLSARYIRCHRGDRAKYKTSQMFEKGIEKKKDELNAKSLPVSCKNTLQSVFDRRKGKKTKQRNKGKTLKQCCRFFLSGVVPVGPWEHSNDFNEEDLFLIEIRFLFYLAATSRIL